MSKNQKKYIKTIKKIKGHDIYDYIYKYIKNNKKYIKKINKKLIIKKINNYSKEYNYMDSLYND